VATFSLPAHVRTSPKGGGRIAAFALLLLLNCPWAVASLKNYPLSFEVREDGQHSAIVVRNDGPSVMSARLVVSGHNIGVNRASPIDIVVPRYTSQRLVRVWPAAPDRPTQLTYRSTHHFGNARARHDPVTHYRLPFEDGRTFRIAQCFGGTLTTHDSEHDRHAIDIEMPEDTPIVAARAGTVVDVTIENFAGATDPDLLDRANSVVILHDDGTIAQYAHLAQRPAVVSRGQRVAAGDRIGFSGNTGYSSGPHLHFAVSRPSVNADGAMQQVALPITFFIYDPPVPIVLRQGMSVTATYNAPFQEPMRPPLPATVNSSVATSPIGHTTKAAGALAGTSGNRGGTAEFYRELTRQRSGLPTWAWVVVLLAIWLTHRVRRRNREIALDDTRRLEPRIDPIIDRGPASGTPRP